MSLRSPARRRAVPHALALVALVALPACGGDGPTTPATITETLTLAPAPGTGAVLLTLGPLPPGTTLTVLHGPSIYQALERPTPSTASLLLVGDALDGPTLRVVRPGGAPRPSATVTEVADTTNKLREPSTVRVSWSTSMP